MTSLSVILGLYGGLLGAILGSFAAVISERGGEGKSLGGRSRCACGRQLKVVENIPILGWLRAAGTARCCGSSIPFTYLGWEIVGAVSVASGALLGGAAGAGAGAAALLLGAFISASLRRRKARSPGSLQTRGS